MPLPLALTDDQRDTLMRCASALQRADRDRFLQLRTRRAITATI